jgi:hypothetical protein
MIDKSLKAGVRRHPLPAARTVHCYTGTLL